jgi:voltage-gated potassium channel
LDRLGGSRGAPDGAPHGAPPGGWPAVASEDLPPRRLVLRALLRALLTATALVVLYYTLPITGESNGSPTVILAVGLLAFAIAIAWQVRAILRSEYPGLRAIEALGAAIPLFLIVFASAYLMLAGSQVEAFSEPLDKTGALYFTVTVFSTVGFGDITPRTELARVVTMVQMLGDLLVLGLIVRVMLGAVKAGVQRRDAATAAGGASGPSRDFTHKG